MNKFFVFLAELNGWHLMLFALISTLIVFYLVPIEEQMQYRKSVAPVMYFSFMYLISPYFFYNRLERSRLWHARNYLHGNKVDHSLNLRISDIQYPIKINSEISFTKKIWGYIYASSRVMFFITVGIIVAHIPASLITNFGKIPFDIAVKTLFNI